MNAAGGRQGILSLAVKDKAALYNAYMPFVKGGGIFVPTPKRYFLGDEVFLLLTLPVAAQLLGRAAYMSGATLRGLKGEDPLAEVVERQKAPLEERLRG